ncbi:MAG TPA: substrate-binding domain-containing protein, partial [Acidobacteriaceae bacterium]|nr:substrate-binding domain-containing protein [Acidobacteriaceae bacterium]
MFSLIRFGLIRFLRRSFALAALLVATMLASSAVTLRAQTGTTVRVAAAADLEPLLPAVLANYERQTGQHVEASFASSATLATQIENGAPFDLFLAANMAFPEKVAQDG